jgi:hypothetical protein
MPRSFALLAVAAVLLAAFAMIETRSPQALLPVRVLRDRNRTGAYLSYAGVGIFIFGMFRPRTRVRMLSTAHPLRRVNRSHAARFAPCHLARAGERFLVVSRLLDESGTE